VLYSSALTGTATKLLTLLVVSLHVTVVKPSATIAAKLARTTGATPYATPTESLLRLTQQENIRKSGRMDVNLPALEMVFVMGSATTPTRVLMEVTAVLRPTPILRVPILIP
jgi:hypothetical protein